MRKPTYLQKRLIIRLAVWAIESHFLIILSQCFGNLWHLQFRDSFDHDMIGLCKKVSDVLNVKIQGDYNFSAVSSSGRVFT